MRTPLTIIILLIVFCQTEAQDIHLSNYSLMPGLYNPAWNHAISQDMHLGLIHRNQGFQITPNSYQTLGAYIQSKLAGDIRGKDRLHLHGMMLSDESGKGQLQQTNMALGLSYHMALDQSARHVLSLAARGSFQQITLSGRDDLLFEEDLIGSGFSEGSAFEQVSNVNWTLGLAHFSQISDLMSVWGGLALGSVNHYSTDKKEAAIRVNAHLAMEYFLSPEFSLSPRVYYQRLRNTENVIAQLISAYTVNASNNLVMEFGVGQRFQDAFQVLAGVQFQNWRMGFSFDISTSSLADVGGVSSGFELGLMYSFSFPKKVYYPKPSIQIDEIAMTSIRIDREPLIKLEYLVLDTTLKLTNGQLKLINMITADTLHLTSYQNTLVEAALNPDGQYQLITNKPGYYVDTLEFSTREIDLDSIIRKMSFLQAVPPSVVKVEKGEAVRLNSVYYDFNEYQILPESEAQLEIIFRAMNAYPDLVIEISSHTDARGGDTFNLELSEKRARSVIDWLKGKGIAESRLVAKGFGETKLLNHCVNGADCTEEQHRLNRRTEFRILKGPDVIYLR